MQRINLLVIMPLKFFECSITDTSKFARIYKLNSYLSTPNTTKLKLCDFYIFQFVFFIHLHQQSQRLFQYFLPETAHLGFGSHA